MASHGDLSAAPLRGATAQGNFTTTATSEDPYCYQTGFNNRFASEAIPGTLPHAQNTPQRCKYDLFSEQLNGTSFVSSRASIQHAWFYRIRPSLAHGPLDKIKSLSQIQSNFSLGNPEIEYSPAEQVWDAFPLSSDEEKTDFIQGLKSICGHGDPTLKDGLVIHTYAANTSMKNKAFCNNDGDMLIVPQLGRLDIQTEFGRMMVKPGEICVLQAGIRFSISLPDGPSRGYIQEIFGTHYTLPELGPIGSNGMALPRDFEMPVASFQIDLSSWEIVYKLCGSLYSCIQDHTPFDVIAWHGNYVPYKYELSRFINSATVDRDQSDPSIYTVLVAKGKQGETISDFMVFNEKFVVTKNTFRPPYYHRNVCTEVMGMVKGAWYGTGHNLEPGGLSYEASFMGHGESIEKWREASTVGLEPMRISIGSIAFMFHISAHVGLTKFALECPTRNVVQITMWENIRGGFLDHLEEVEKDLLSRSLPGLSSF